MEKNWLGYTLDFVEKIIGKKAMGKFKVFVIKNLLYKKEFKTIQHCFDVHKSELPKAMKLKFTLFEYCEFWLTRQIGDEYTMASRDGTVVDCKVAYYPMPGYADLRALIEIALPNGGTDFREVPIHYLIKKTNEKIK
jgi:hypothetical protein